MHQVLGAVGLNNATGDRLLREFHAALPDDDLEEGEGEGEEEGVALPEGGDAGANTHEATST